MKKTKKDQQDQEFTAIIGDTEIEVSQKFQFICRKGIFQMFLNGIHIACPFLQLFRSSYDCKFLLIIIIAEEDKMAGFFFYVNDNRENVLNNVK